MKKIPPMLAVSLALSLSLLSSAACKPGGEAQDPASETDTTGGTRTASESAADAAALRDASHEGRLQAVRTALGKGVNVNALDQEKRSALMLAAFNGHTEVVRTLLQKGANVHFKDSMGRTALMYASSGPSPDTVRLLLENKSDPDIQDTGEGWTALMFAAGEGQGEVVQVLLEHGADRSLKDVDGETALDFAQKNGHTFVVRILSDK